MRHRIASLVSSLRDAPALLLIGAAVWLPACASAPDRTLDTSGPVDPQSLSARLRCPGGAVLTHGQTLGVETALWCEKTGGIKHGPFIEWYPNHQKKTAGEYLEGHRQGPWSFWNPDGQLDSR